jgi:hypothetical protein
MEFLEMIKALAARSKSKKQVCSPRKLVSLLIFVCYERSSHVCH